MGKPIVAEERIDEDLMLVEEHMLWISVCAPSSFAGVEVERRVFLNFRESGTSDGWQLATERSDVRVECAGDPHRSHWLFIC